MHSFDYFIRSLEILNELGMRWFERISVDIMCKGGVEDGLFDPVNNRIVRLIRLEPHGVFIFPKTS